MQITSSEIQYSSRHTLVEAHTRREELVAGVSANGAWDPEGLQDGTVRKREQQVDQSFPSRSEATLLDEYLGGRSLESLRAQVNAGPIDDGAADGSRSALDRGELDGVAADIDLLARLTRAAGQTLDLEDLARQLVSAGGPAEGPSGLLALLNGAAPSAPIEAVIPVDTEIKPEDELKMRLIRSAVEAFSGRSLKLLNPANLDLRLPPEGGSAPPVGKTPPHPLPEEEAAEAEPGPTFGLWYHRQETHYERETTTFQARGIVHTTDGEEIDIDVSLTMGRQFASEEEFEVQVGGSVQDPLVVNFSGTAAELSERTYDFDLDANGEAERIHFVGPNSGFLALDHDGSGTIDDGSELFGAHTGNGFTELAAYDEDGNQFIDEGDSVYDRLRIWQKDSDGEDHLLALGQSGVGAIYLGHTTTPFQVKDEANQLQGVVRSSGIYLKEDGGAGTVQQLDLVV